MLLDSEMREPVFRYFEQRYDTLRIFEEKNIGRSRADFLIVLPDEIIGCEIKSDGDSYFRLCSQIKDYDRYCDRSFLITGVSHLASAEKHIPEYWGIISVSKTMGEITSSEVRPAECAEEDTRRFKRQLSLLWKNELSFILESNELPKYSGKSKKFICDRLLERLDAETLKKAMCDRLFERDYTVYNDR